MKSSKSLIVLGLGAAAALLLLGKSKSSAGGPLPGQTSKSGAGVGPLPGRTTKPVSGVPLKNDFVFDTVLRSTPQDHGDLALQQQAQGLSSSWTTAKNEDFLRRFGKIYEDSFYGDPDLPPSTFECQTDPGTLPISGLDNRFSTLMNYGFSPSTGDISGLSSNDSIISKHTAGYKAAAALFNDAGFPLAARCILAKSQANMLNYLSLHSQPSLLGVLHS